MKILKNNRIILIVLLILSIVVGVQAVESKKKKEITRQMTHTTDESSEESSITLDVEFKNYKDENPDFLEFEVFMNTHSEELSKYDNIEDFLEIKINEIIVKPKIVFEKRGSGHHITNILKISNKYEGKRILDKNTKDIKLIFKNIGDVKKRTHSYKF